MLKEIEEISATKKRLKIEIPAEIVEEEIQKALREIQKKVTIPGFRPGKAPMSIIEKKFGKDAESDVLEKLLTESYQEALKKTNLKPLLPPITEDEINIKRNQPLSFELVVEVRPELTNLNYENIEVEDISIEVKEQEIQETLERLSSSRGTYEPIDEPARFEDIVIIDYKTDIGKEAKDFIYKLGEGSFSEDFSKALEGRRKGETFNVTIDFPEDSVADFAGKKVNFEITIKEVKRKYNIPLEKLPQELGFEDADSLRNYVIQFLENLKKEQALKKQKFDILTKLLEINDFELPEGLVEMEIKRITEEYEALGVDIKEQIDKITEQAKRNVKTYILIDYISEKEGISVSNEDIIQEILDGAKKYNVTPQALMNFYITRDGSLDGLKIIILEKKVFNLLLQKAQKTKKEVAEG